MPRRSSRLILLIAISALLLPATVLAGDSGSERKTSVAGDLSSPWFHIGGGGGVAIGMDLEGFALDPVAPLGRFTIGAGFYTFLLYIGGTADVSFQGDPPVTLSGAATIGVAIPIPVWHPMIGLRVGGGGHLLAGTWYSHFTAGPQVGFILRQFDGKPGFRAMLDVAGIYTPSRPALGLEVVLTAALVL